MDPDRLNNNEAERKKKPMERIDSDNPEEMESVASLLPPSTFHLAFRFIISILPDAAFSA